MIPQFLFAKKHLSWSKVSTKLHKNIKSTELYCIIYKLYSIKRKGENFSACQIDSSLRSFVCIFWYFLDESIPIHEYFIFPYYYTPMFNLIHVYAVQYNLFYVFALVESVKSIFCVFFIPSPQIDIFHRSNAPLITVSTNVQVISIYNRRHSIYTNHTHQP